MYEVAILYAGFQKYPQVPSAMICLYSEGCVFNTKGGILKVLDLSAPERFFYTSPRRRTQ